MNRVFIWVVFHALCHIAIFLLGQGILIVSFFLLLCHMLSFGILVIGMFDLGFQNVIVWARSARDQVVEFENPGYPHFQN